MRRIRIAETEQVAPVADAEPWIWEAMVKPEEWRSLTGPEGQRDEAQYVETRALSGKDVGTSAHSGNRGDIGLQRRREKRGQVGPQVYKVPMKYPPSLRQSQFSTSSPSAVLQWVELLSAITLASTYSLMVGDVASSYTWSAGLRSSGSVAILGSVKAGSGSPSSVGSG